MSLRLVFSMSFLAGAVISAGLDDPRVGVLVVGLATAAVTTFAFALWGLWLGREVRRAKRRHPGRSKVPVERYPQLREHAYGYERESDRYGDDCG
jgi:hypothetical protein